MTQKITHCIGVALMCVCIFFVAPVFAYSSPGNASGFVNDFANVLDADTRTNLEQKLSQFEKDTQHEVVVVTVQSLGDDYIENYAVQLFKEWGIGKEKADNGVLFLIAPSEKKVRIEVGYGLEGALVDSETNAIIQDYVLPEFKKNNYALGIEAGVDGIIQATQGEVVLQPRSKKVDWGEIVFFIIFGLVWGFGILLQIFASTKSWWLGGVFGAVAGGVITFFGFFGISHIVGGVLTVILVILGLAFDFFASKYSETILKNIKNASNNSNGGFGGGSWGGGSSGGGFGGFGGGGSGGGGSSGSW